MARLKLLMLTLGFAGLSLTPAASAQWVQWTVASGGNDHFYRLTGMPQAWQNAEAEAIALGGHLVSIGSVAEETFVETNFLVGATQQQALWIGLTDQTSEGNFVWVDGSPLGFTNWMPGEPNNAGSGENFACMNWHYSCCLGPANFGKWNDASSTGTTAYGGSSNGPYLGVVEVASTPPCNEDINGDLVVNTSDLILLLQKFGQSVAVGAPGDINRDGAVNTLDLVLLLSRFGRNC